MIDGFSANTYNAAMGGPEGEKVVARAVNDIEEHSRKVAEEIELAKNKKFSDLSPLEQLIFNLDSGLEKFR